MDLKKISRTSLVCYATIIIVLHLYLIWLFIVNYKAALVLFALLGKLYSYLFCEFYFKRKWPHIKEKLEPLKNRCSEIGNLNIFGIPLKRIIPLIFVVAFFLWSLSPILFNSVKLRSFGGLALLILIAVGASSNQRKINWRPVIGGYFLQFLFGNIFLKLDAGNRGLQFAVSKVVSFLDLTTHGTGFVYGFIAAPPPICGFNYVFMFTALQIIIFFGAVVAILYRYGIIQAILTRIAFVMKITVGTSGVESFYTAACIFLGQTESALLVGPSLSKCTKSELHTIMTAGFACIAGSLFSAFIAFGACPSYLLSATVMSASVSLAISKIVYPETEETSEEPEVEVWQDEERRSAGLISCISESAIHSSRLVVAIAVNLIVFLAILAFINSILTYFGEMVGIKDFTLNWLFSKMFYPLAYMMGASDAEDEQVAQKETALVAELLGIKTVLNEFIAYKHLAHLVKTGQLVGNSLTLFTVIVTLQSITENCKTRARMIATFACCGFSNFSMVGATLGVLGQLIPEKKAVITELVFRALASGAISGFSTAIVAGIIVDSPIACEPKSSGLGCIELEDIWNLMNRNVSTLV